MLHFLAAQQTRYSLLLALIRGEEQTKQRLADHCWSLAQALESSADAIDQRLWQWRTLAPPTPALSALSTAAASKVLGQAPSRGVASDGSIGLRHPISSRDPITLALWGMLGSQDSYVGNEKGAGKMVKTVASLSSPGVSVVPTTIASVPTFHDLTQAAKAAVACETEQQEAVLRREKQCAQWCRDLEAAAADLTDLVHLPPVMSAPASGLAHSPGAASRDPEPAEEGPGPDHSVEGGMVRLRCDESDQVCSHARFFLLLPSFPV